MNGPFEDVSIDDYIGGATCVKCENHCVSENPFLKLAKAIHKKRNWIVGVCLFVTLFALFLYVCYSDDNIPNPENKIPSYVYLMNIGVLGLTVLTVITVVISTLVVKNADEKKV